MESQSARPLACKQKQDGLFASLVKVVGLGLVFGLEVTEVRKKLSVGVRVVVDRAKYLFAVVVHPSVQWKWIRKHWPAARLRIHWDAANFSWDGVQCLCLTERFEVPISAITDSHSLGSTFQWREVKAFLEGEPAVSEVFRQDPGQFEWREVKAFLKGERAVNEGFRHEHGQFEAYRRIATPRLLDAPPEDFTVMVKILPTGEFRVVNGLHRLAIACVKGRTSVHVKVALGHNEHRTLRGGWKEELKWFFLPFR